MKEKIIPRIADEVTDRFSALILKNCSVSVQTEQGIGKVVKTSVLTGLIEVELKGKKRITFKGRQVTDLDSCLRY